MSKPILNEAPVEDRLVFTTSRDQCQFTLIPTGADKPPKLTGYGIVFNQLSSARIASGKAGEKGLKNGDIYYVRSKPGSVVYTQSKPVQVLYNHNGDEILGTVANGTLAFAEDAYGVKIECIPPRTQYARDCFALVEDKYIDGMSYGSFPLEFKISKEGGKTIVEYTKQLVDEFTVTGQPAFVGTSVAVEYKAERAVVGTTPLRNEHALRLAEYEIQEFSLDGPQSVDQVDSSGVNPDGPGTFVKAASDAVQALSAVLDNGVCDGDGEDDDCEEYRGALQSAKDAVSACLNNTGASNLRAAVAACDTAGAMARNYKDSLSQQAAVECADLSMAILTVLGG
jgi:HK97 family phage prohead protease